MKIFIIQPMRNKTTEEIMERRKEIISLIYLAFPNRTIDIIDQISFSDAKIMSPITMLSRSISLMSDADLVVRDSYDKFGDNYGCMIESDVANYYDIPIISMGILKMLAELPND